MAWLSVVRERAKPRAAAQQAIVRHPHRGGRRHWRLPADVTSTWQVINLAAGSDHKQFPVTLPVTGELATPTFSREGLARLKSGLQRAGLAASWFAWPPEHDRSRSPYRGLEPLEADDAGIPPMRVTHVTSGGSHSGSRTGS